jgi:hypothetical protein
LRQSSRAPNNTNEPASSGTTEAAWEKAFLKLFAAQETQWLALSNQIVAIEEKRLRSSQSIRSSAENVSSSYTSGLGHIVEEMAEELQRVTTLLTRARPVNSATNNSTGHTGINSKKKVKRTIKKDLLSTTNGSSYTYADYENTENSNRLNQVRL